METKISNQALKALLALSFLPISLGSEAALAGRRAPTPPVRCEARKVCADKMEKVSAQDAATEATSKGPLPKGQAKQGELLREVSTAGAAVSCDAKKICEEQKSKAEKDELCREDDKKSIAENIETASKKCAGDVSAALAGGQTEAAALDQNGQPNSTNTAPKESPAGDKGGESSGGGMSGMMSALPMVGMLAMAAMKKKQEQDAAALAQAQQLYDGAIQANGTMDCSKSNALIYSRCDSQMESRCASNMDDPTCATFSARYCGPTSGAVAQISVQPQTPPGVILGVDPNSLIGGVGDGVSTTFCRNVTAWNFCKTSGRQFCPSCIKIRSQQNPTCVQNPALCMAQNSSAEVEKAKLACPMDPAFADPSYAGSEGGSVANLAMGSGNATGAGAALVLPQSVEGGRELASSGGMRPASVSAPSSDIEGRYGPSLFNSTSQVIRRRCQAGRLNNCP